MASPLPDNTFAFWHALAARDPAEAARTVLGRMGRLSPEHRRAIWAVEPTAAALTAEFTRGIATGGFLAGVPFAVKDLFAVGGLSTGAGSTFLAAVRGVDPEDAPLVRHLRAAGAVFAGKVHLHEFAYGLTGENPHFGDGPNLRLPGRVSGGSSSGSAAVVAGGIVPLALGTDTGGSVRVPAAFNGLWGYRAQPRDRWMERCFPLSPTFDTAGWFASNPVDLLTMQRGMFGAPGRSAHHAFVRLAARELDPEMTGEFATALDSAAAAFATPLADDERTELRRALDGALQAYVIIQSSEAAAVHAPWLDTHRIEYDPVVWARIDGGRRWSPTDIAGAYAKREDVRLAFAALFRRYGGLVLPAAPFPALTKWECTDANRTRILSLTHAASLAGAPVLTVPVPLGKTPAGFGGLQIIIPDYHTAAVERVLSDAELFTAWRERDTP